MLVGALAAGVLLASDVFHSAASVDSLLFGSLLLIDDGDVLLAFVPLIAVVLAAAVAGRAGSPPASTRPRRARSACAPACPTRCCTAPSR